MSPNRDRLHSNITSKTKAHKWLLVEGEDIYEMEKKIRTEHIFCEQTKHGKG